MSGSTAHRLRKASRAKRAEYVRRVSYTGNIKIPFINEELDEFAERYIQTGDESLICLFPSTIRR